MARDYLLPMTEPTRPLIVRLRNWVGDVTLGLPMLTRLAEAGYDLRLVGKGWARDLLAGHGWRVEVLPRKPTDRVRLLRRLRAQARADDPGFDRRLNALCLPYSFSSALEFRLAGLRALGHAYEGRGLLLARSLPRRENTHELEVYWELGNALLGAQAPPPTSLGLHPSAAQRREARALVAQHAIAPGYIVICPFAGGTWDGKDKTWPGFAAFAAGPLRGFGRDIVVCPGPGEEPQARADFAATTVLSGVGLGVYAALIEDAALMISNDTGPGHIAAAVGTPLISVLGPSNPALWGAWGTNVHNVRHPPGWPTEQEVAAAVARVIPTNPRRTPC